jgi:hypothetical protein
MTHRLVPGALAEHGVSAPIRLSNRWTFVFQVGTPLGIALLLLVAALAFADMLPGRGADPRVTPWHILSVAIVAALVWSVLLVRLKEAWLDGDALRVSSFRHTERIPLAQIREVRTWKWLNPKVVKVHFEGDSRFGKSIPFVLPAQLFPIPWEDHPLAQALRGQVAKARQKSGVM